MKNGKFKGSALMLALLMAVMGLSGCGNQNSASKDGKVVISIANFSRQRKPSRNSMKR